MKKSIVFVLLLCCTLIIDASAQCAMCRASVETNLSEGRNVIGSSINFGILYLLCVPYLLVAGLIWMWYRTGKKELIEKQQLQARMDEIYKK
ncbi:MAG: hypothetical protein ACRCVT_00265 [Leadbetterella sp.]